MSSVEAPIVPGWRADLQTRSHDMSHSRGLSSAVACAIAGVAAAQVTIAPGTATFVDISATGTPLLGVYDDSAHGFTSTVGNELFPAGPVVVASNGYVLAGPTP